jgi:hypothetical protein
MLSLLKKEDRGLSKGFLLLEVVLSILMVASGLLFIMRSYSTSLKVSGVARGLTNACFLLEEKLFDMDAKGFKEGVQEGESEGRFEPGPYIWYLQIYTMGDKKEMDKVELRIAWKKQKISISTFRGTKREG